MSCRLILCRFLPLLCLPLATSALAARPLVTDDARLSTAGSCQLESWLRADRDHHEAWALPTCNPGGNLEITLGGGQAWAADSPRTVDYVLQAKTLFRPLRPNDWGWGLAVGTVRHPEVAPGPNLLGNRYVYLPLSHSLSDDDRVVLHLNLGWLQDKARGNASTTWGIGGEFRISDSWQGIAESFGDDHVPAYGQIGLRRTLIPALLQIDATVGRQFAGANSPAWLSIGLRLTPARLF
ncbi:MAG: hypothetical protein PHT48_03640 [Dechloromonas sp.]|nr:hypothetical protein [Dechloromonas sp.]